MDIVLIIIKRLREKNVTIMNKKSEIYGAWQNKTNVCSFFLSTNDPIIR